jgi:hypothetical protein
MDPMSDRDGPLRLPARFVLLREYRSFIYPSLLYCSMTQNPKAVPEGMK